MVLNGERKPRPLSSLCRLILIWLGGLLAIALVCVLAMHIHSRLDRELQDVPEVERRALYERTLETLRASCMQARGPTFTDYCREQADFVRRFPECDSECRELAARFAPHPSR